MIDCLSFKAQLTDHEQKVLEKDLLLEQVSRLTERLKKKEGSRRQTTLQIGKKVNSYQSKLKDGTRKMMALISELSLQRVKRLIFSYALLYLHN